MGLVLGVKWIKMMVKGLFMESREEVVWRLCLMEVKKGNIKSVKVM